MVSKNAIAFLALVALVLSTSITTSTPANDSASPSPVATSTPTDRASDTGSCPVRRTSSTT